MRLTRIHLEEDVAKSFHFEGSTGIDFNRAGTPLMEIVSEPEIDSPEEAFAYLTALQQILVYGAVSDADMEKGQLRCDCNVSVRVAGTELLGTKIEIKNMNSISAVRRALPTISRARSISAKWRKLVRTRRWLCFRRPSPCAPRKALTIPLFPDPDLLPSRPALFSRSSRGAPDFRRKRDRSCAL